MKTTKIFGCTAVLMAVTALAGCGGKSASKVMEGFDTANNATQYVLNYKENYKVESDQPGYESFLSDTDNEYTIYRDVANDYLLAKSRRFNRLDVWTKNEAREFLAYGEGGTFKASTSTTEATVLNLNSTTPKAYLNEVITGTTTDNVGFVDDDIIWYNAGNNQGKEYAVKYFVLKDVDLETVNASTYKTNKDGGVTVTYNAATVGYQGDSGIFQMTPISGQKYAAQVTIETNDKGYVTSLSQTFNAKIQMPFGNPQPVISLTGTRTVTVTYDTFEKVTHETLTKVSNPDAQVYFEQSANGTFSVKQYTANPMENTPVSSLDRVAVGQTLWIDATAADGYEIAKVEVNGAKVTPYGPFYVYTVSDETNLKIAVTFAVPREENGNGLAVIDVTCPLSYSVFSFDMAGPNPSNFASVENGENGYEVEPSAVKWVGVLINAGTATVYATLDGEADAFMTFPGAAMGLEGTLYCFAVDKAYNYDVTFVVA